MKKIKVRLGHRSYNIIIGKGIVSNIKDYVPDDILKNPLMVVTNAKIRSIYGRKILGVLKKINRDLIVREVPDSEKAKSFNVYSQLITALASIRKRSKPTLIALGGGVIGDVTGFAAATFRRGIPYIQIPTTLLSQVDSAIGGKVAIDLPQAKNLVGSFYQPRVVLSDLSFLQSLPKKEILNGLAEIMKYGIIYDPALFRLIEKNLDKIIRLEEKPLERVVWECASIKAGVVERDELDERGIRVILNFGHTFAHAIESAFRYSKSYTHGEAVAIGMVMASDMAYNLGMLGIGHLERIRRVVGNAGLPTKIRSMGIKKLIRALEYDKKFLTRKNRFVLPRCIGKVETVEGIPEIIIRNVLKRGGA